MKQKPPVDPRMTGNILIRGKGREGREEEGEGRVGRWRQRKVLERGGREARGLWSLECLGESKSAGNIEGDGELQIKYRWEGGRFLGRQWLLLHGPVARGERPAAALRASTP